MEPYEFLLDLTPKGAPAVRVTCSQNDVNLLFEQKMETNE
jgi:hypothetical protein